MREASRNWRHPACSAERECGPLIPLTRTRPGLAMRKRSAKTTTAVARAAFALPLRVFTPLLRGPGPGWQCVRGVRTPDPCYAPNFAFTRARPGLAVRKRGARRQNAQPNNVALRAAGPGWRCVRGLRDSKMRNQITSPYTRPAWAGKSKRATENNVS